MSNIYDFRPGRSLKGVSPQEVGQALESIRATTGTLTPAAVLEVASDPASPLHNVFEWNDTEAARRYRMGQARQIITSIRVLNSPAARPITAFVSVRTPEHGRQYVPTVEALSQEELTVRVLTEVRTFIESLERRYAHFAELAEVIGTLKRNVG